MESELVTPPFRVYQTDTHVIVEAQCPLTPANLKPEAVVEETIFALRCPPYYLPLHFPASLSSVEEVHRSASIVRVHLRKADVGLDFIGLEDIQPTMFVDADPQSSTAAAAAGSSRQKREKDEEAEAILKEVLQRENMTAVKEDKPEKRSSETRGFGALFANLSTEELEANQAATESAEDQRFDEQSYLDSFVDEEGEIEDLLRWKYEAGSSSSSATTAEPAESAVPGHLRLLLVDLLYAYHLALLVSTGPPIYPWLLCTLSRSLSAPPAPPFATSDTVSSVLRSGFRRGLAYPLHRNWRLCRRAAEDVVSRLSAGSQEILAGLSDMSDCLVEGEKEATEGPDEAARWGILNESVVRPLIAKVQADSDAAFFALSEEVKAAAQGLTKSNVAPSWDLELLEQMAEEVIAEQRGEQESRLKEDVKSILDMCRSLTPPLALQEGHDAFAGERDAQEERKLKDWRTKDAPSTLRKLIKTLQTYTIRSGRLKGQASDVAVGVQAAVTIAASRFVARSPWASRESRTLARAILSSPIKPTVAVIGHVLRDHLRSLFASSSPGSVNEEGRLRHERAHLSNSAKMSAYSEGERWKGKQRADMPGLDMARSDGAGSHLTLKVCLEMIAALSSSKRARPGDEPWEALWPLIVPPLITLIEDSDPIWRERGTRLLVEQVLTGRTASGGVVCESLSMAKLQAVPVQLLQRSNLVPLLQTTLFNSLTYLSHPLGASLLHYALSALILLARSLPERSRERAEMLMRILQEGVLRTWTFMPKSIGSMPESLDADEDQEGDEQGEEPATERDVLTTTFTHLSSLCLELEILSARFIDVALDFLSAQIAGLYESLVRGTSTRPDLKAFAGLVDVEQERRKTKGKLVRGREAVRASRVLVEQACAGALVEPTVVAASASASGKSQKPSSDEEQSASKQDPFFPSVPPGLAQWTSKCLSAYVKAWLALSDAPTLHDAHVELRALQREKEQLAGELRRAVRVWNRVLPERVEEIRAKVVAAEPCLQDLFAAL